VVGLVVLGLLGGGYQFWFRGSSFVAVERVTVTGMSGPERSAAETALTTAAKDMTTLDVDVDALRAAVAGLSTVVGVEADADFPHGLAITVEDRPPVMIATSGGRAVPVAGDGTVLSGVEASSEQLPTVPVDDLPARGELTGAPLEIAVVMGAAPKPLLELVEAVSYGGAEGVQVTLRGDVPVYFGTGDDAADKWTAAAAVLADPSIDTLTYLDVRVAERPAVGGAAPAVSESTTDTTAPETGLEAPVTP
jgi:cell division protein FtsQ